MSEYYNRENGNHVDVWFKGDPDPTWPDLEKAPEFIDQINKLDMEFYVLIRHAFDKYSAFTNEYDFHDKFEERDQ